MHCSRPEPLAECVFVCVLLPHWTGTTTHLQPVNTHTRTVNMHFCISQHFLKLSVFPSHFVLQTYTELCILFPPKTQTNFEATNVKVAVLHVVELSLLSSPLLSSPHLRELKGVVISLSSDGHLLCSYMGTDPSFFSTPKVDAREVDYEQVDAEMKKLQKFIREATKTQGRRLMVDWQRF